MQKVRDVILVLFHTKGGHWTCVQKRDQKGVGRKIGTMVGYGE
jgi:hypothetical protein